MTDPCASPDLKPVDDTIADLLLAAQSLRETEDIAVENGLGRILAEAVSSTVDVPGYDNSAMDGYAIVSSDTLGDEAVQLPVTQRIAAGDTGTPLKAGEVARIFTGAPIPAGADAVIMQEQVATKDDQIIIKRQVPAGENIRPQGNDIRANSEIIAPGERLRGQHLGLIASVGVARIRVYRRLKVGLFFTGDELVPPGQPLQAGQIYNSNQYTLLGLLENLGCEIDNLGLIEDSLEATKSAMLKAAKTNDLVITSGGVSVGEEDYVKPAVESVGQLDTWRVAIKPGKPFAFGRIGDTVDNSATNNNNAAIFMGLPGNPVSVFVTFLILVRPYLLKMQGQAAVLPMPLQVPAGFDWARPRPRREFLRVRLQANKDAGLHAISFPRQGSDVLSSAAWADGLVEVPENMTLKAGDLVNYYPFSDLLGG